MYSQSEPDDDFDMMADNRFVDRGEEFLILVENRPATRVFRNSHLSHVTTDITSTAASLGTYYHLPVITESPEGAVYIPSMTSPSSDSSDLQSPTHMFMSSGYDSSASWDAQDSTQAASVASSEYDSDIVTTDLQSPTDETSYLRHYDHKLADEEEERLDEISDEDDVTVDDEDLDTSLLSVEVAPSKEIITEDIVSDAKYSTDEASRLPSRQSAAEWDVSDMAADDLNVSMDRVGDFNSSIDTYNLSTLVIHRDIVISDLQDKFAEERALDSKTIDTSLLTFTSAGSDSKTTDTSLLTFTSAGSDSKTADTSLLTFTSAGSGVGGGSVDDLALREGSAQRGTVPDVHADNQVYVDYRKTVDISADNAIATATNIVMHDSKYNQDVMHDSKYEQDVIHDSKYEQDDTVPELSTNDLALVNKGNCDELSRSELEYRRPYRETLITSVSGSKRTISSGSVTTPDTLAEEPPVGEDDRSETQRTTHTESSSQARYISTLDIPPNVARNAETAPWSDADLEEGGECCETTFDISGSAESLTYEHELHPVTASLQRSFGATFDIGRPRATPVTLTASHWTQVSQFSTSYIKDDEHWANENPVGSLATWDKSEVLSGEESELASNVYGAAEGLVKQTAVLGDSGRSVNSAGGEQIQSIDENITGIELEESEVGNYELPSHVCSSTLLPILSEHSGFVTSQHSRVVSTLEETDSGKVCYVSSIQSDEDESDGDSECRKINHLDIYVKDYAEKEGSSQPDDAAEHRTLFQCETVYREEDFAEHEHLEERLDYSQAEYRGETQYEQDEDSSVFKVKDTADRRDIKIRDTLQPLNFDYSEQDYPELESYTRFESSAESMEPSFGHIAVEPDADRQEYSERGSDDESDKGEKYPEHRENELHQVPVEAQEDDSLLVPVGVQEDDSLLVPVGLEEEYSHLVPVGMEEEYSHLVSVGTEEDDSHLVSLVPVATDSMVDAVKPDDLYEPSVNRSEDFMLAQKPQTLLYMKEKEMIHDVDADDRSGSPSRHLDAAVMGLEHPIIESTEKEIADMELQKHDEGDKHRHLDNDEEDEMDEEGDDEEYAFDNSEEEEIEDEEDVLDTWGQNEEEDKLEKKQADEEIEDEEDVLDTLKQNEEKDRLEKEQADEENKRAKLDQSTHKEECKQADDEKSDEIDNEESDEVDDAESDEVDDEESDEVDDEESDEVDDDEEDEEYGQRILEPIEISEAQRVQDEKTIPQSTEAAVSKPVSTEQANVEINRDERRLDSDRWQDSSLLASEQQQREPADKNTTEDLVELEQAKDQKERKVHAVQYDFAGGDIDVKTDNVSIEQILDTSSFLQEDDQNHLSNVDSPERQLYSRLSDDSEHHGDFPLEDVTDHSRQTVGHGERLESEYLPSLERWEEFAQIQVPHTFSYTRTVPSDQTMQPVKDSQLEGQKASDDTDNEDSIYSAAVVKSELDTKEHSSVSMDTPPDSKDMKSKRPASAMESESDPDDNESSELPTAAVDSDTEDITSPESQFVAVDSDTEDITSPESQFVAVDSDTEGITSPECRLAAVDSDTEDITSPESQFVAVDSDTEDITSPESQLAAVDSDTEDITSPESQFVAVDSDTEDITSPESQFVAVDSDTEGITSPECRLAAVDSDTEDITSPESQFVAVDSDTEDITSPESQFAAVDSDTEGITSPESRLAAVDSDTEDITSPESQFVAVDSDTEDITSPESQLAAVDSDTEDITSPESQFVAVEPDTEDITSPESQFAAVESEHDTEDIASPDTEGSTPKDEVPKTVQDKENFLESENNDTAKEERDAESLVSASVNATGDKKVDSNSMITRQNISEISDGEIEKSHGGDVTDDEQKHYHFDDESEENSLEEEDESGETENESEENLVLVESGNRDMSVGDSPELDNVGDITEMPVSATATDYSENVVFDNTPGPIDYTPSPSFRQEPHDSDVSFGGLLEEKDEESMKDTEEESLEENKEESQEEESLEEEDEVSEPESQEDSRNWKHPDLKGYSRLAENSDDSAAEDNLDNEAYQENKEHFQQQDHSASDSGEAYLQNKEHCQQQDHSASDSGEAYLQNKEHCQQQDHSASDSGEENSEHQLVSAPAGNMGTSQMAAESATVFDLLESQASQSVDRGETFEQIRPSKMFSFVKAPTAIVEDIDEAANVTDDLDYMQALIPPDQSDTEDENVNVAADDRKLYLSVNASSDAAFIGYQNAFHSDADNNEDTAEEGSAEDESFEKDHVDDSDEAADEQDIDEEHGPINASSADAQALKPDIPVSSKTDTFPSQSVHDESDRVSQLLHEPETTNHSLHHETAVLVSQLSSQTDTSLPTHIESLKEVIDMDRAESEEEEEEEEEEAVIKDEPDQVEREPTEDRLTTVPELSTNKPPWYDAIDSEEDESGTSSEEEYDLENRQQEEAEWDVTVDERQEQDKKEDVKEEATEDEVKADDVVAKATASESIHGIEAATTPATDSTELTVAHLLATDELKSVDKSAEDSERLEDNYQVMPDTGHPTDTDSNYLRGIAMDVSLSDAAEADYGTEAGSSTSQVQTQPLEKAADSIAADNITGTIGNKEGEEYFRTVSKTDTISDDDDKIRDSAEEDDFEEKVEDTNDLDNEESSPSVDNAPGLTDSVNIDDILSLAFKRLALTDDEKRDSETKTTLMEQKEIDEPAEPPVSENKNDDEVDVTDLTKVAECFSPKSKQEGDSQECSEEEEEDASHSPEEESESKQEDDACQSWEEREEDVCEPQEEENASYIKTVEDRVDKLVGDQLREVYGREDMASVQKAPVGTYQRLGIQDVMDADQITAFGEKMETCPEQEARDSYRPHSVADTVEVLSTSDLASVVYRAEAEEGNYIKDTGDEVNVAEDLEEENEEYNEKFGETKDDLGFQAECFNSTKVDESTPRIPQQGEESRTDSSGEKITTPVITETSQLTFTDTSENAALSEMVEDSFRKQPETSHREEVPSSTGVEARYDQKIESEETAEARSKQPQRDEEVGLTWSEIQELADVDDIEYDLSDYTPRPEHIEKRVKQTADDVLTSEMSADDLWSALETADGGQIEDLINASILQGGDETVAEIGDLDVLAESSGGANSEKAADHVQLRSHEPEVYMSKPIDNADMKNDYFEASEEEDEPSDVDNSADENADDEFEITLSPSASRKAVFSPGSREDMEETTLSVLHGREENDHDREIKVGNDDVSDENVEKSDMLNFDSTISLNIDVTKVSDKVHRDKLVPELQEEEEEEYDVEEEEGEEWKDVEDEETQRACESDSVQERVAGVPEVREAELSLEKDNLTGRLLAGAGNGDSGHDEDSDDDASDDQDRVDTADVGRRQLKDAAALDRKVGGAAVPEEKMDTDSLRSAQSIEHKQVEVISSVKGYVYNSEDMVNKGPISSTAEDMVNKGPISSTAEDMVNKGPISSTAEDMVNKGPISSTAEASGSSAVFGDLDALKFQEVDVITSQEVDREEEFDDELPMTTLLKESAAEPSPSETQQQCLLEDIKSNKAQAKVVLEKHASLPGQSEKTVPSQGHRLLQDISHLEERAELQCAELRSGVSEQEQHETEIRHLNAAISEAQQQLLASPVRASTVEALKQQIAEHSSLASQIKNYQARVSEINEKSRQLSLRVAQASTLTARKRYLPEMTYRSWLSTSQLETGIKLDSSPMSSSFDSGLDVSATFSQSLQASPNLSATSVSGSFYSSRPAVSSSPAAVKDTTHFKPLSQFDTPDSSTSVHSDATGSSLHQSARSGAAAESSKVKSASVTVPPGSSVLTKLPVAGLSSASHQVITSRFKLEPLWSHSDRNRPPKASTPHVQGWSRSVGAQVTPASGRRAFSLSPDRGHKLYQPVALRPLQPSSLSSSASALLGSGTHLQLFTGGGVHGQKAVVSHLEGALPSSQETRHHSSLFDQKVEPMGHPFGLAQPVEELNQSWTTLQKQVAARERQLQQVLEKQYQYQQAVQELTARMEKAQIVLARSPASLAADVETQAKDYKDNLQALDSIKEDISVVRIHGHQMMEESDTEGNKAMEATMTMLMDRLSSLQSLADQKGRQLQEVVKQKEKHKIDLAAYKKRVDDLEMWLGEMKVRHATSALPTDDPADLLHQQQETKEMQEELNTKLQTISDLAVQCDSLCKLLSPSEAEKLCNQLTGLHARLGEFKLQSIEKQKNLRAALKDSERHQAEMEDYENRVSKLQQWMQETKQMMAPCEPAAAFYRQGDSSQIHQELASDLTKHQQLVHQLSISGLPVPSREKAVLSAVPSEADLHDSWQQLQNDLSKKTAHLESMLQKRKSGETVSLPAVSVGDTSRQLEDIQSLLSQLSLCWQQLQVQVADKQLRLDTVLSFQQQMQSALKAMSSWLDLAEQIALAPSHGAQSEHDRIRQNETLQRDLRSLQSEITTLGSQTQQALQSSSHNHGLIQESLTSLNHRVSILEKESVSRSDELRQVQHLWQQYHDDVRTLRSRMQELQTSVMGPATTSTANLDALVSSINMLETQLKKCQTQLDELKEREKNLSSQHPRAVLPSELGSLRNTYMDLQRMLTERKAGLMQSVSVQEQYQKMLQDYAEFLETAEAKLNTEAIAAVDLTHLQQQFSAHKEFFCDLEVHKAMLDSLALQCDPATQELHSMQHNHLSNLTHILVDRASLHGQRLQRLVQQWNDLAHKLDHLQQFLTQVEDGIPKPIASGDSLATIQDKLGKFKRLQGQLADERPTVFQAVDQGKQILHSITCPALEATVTKLADKWVELNTQLVHELKRTEMIGEQLQIFEAEAMVLRTWMSTARIKLDELKHLSEEDMQNIGNIRTKVEHILEFRKEVQNQLPLKSKVMSVGKQLMANRSYDTRGLDARLAAIEEEWNQLEHSIIPAEQSLHQAQMELMPSRQALHELQIWMEEMEKALAIDANSPIKTLADIELMLKRYKGYKVELASKQLTMDFVNQAVLQPGPHETNVSNEKLEYADKLIDLNERWTKVSSEIKEHLRLLEELSGKWADYEAALAQLQTWFRQQEDKIKRCRLIGHEVGVKQTLKDCKAMQDQLQARKEDMDSIKRLGQSVIDITQQSPGCQRSVRESLNTLSQQWEHLQQQVMPLESLLTDMVGQWARYHADLHSLSQVLVQTEYTLNRYTTVSADVQTLLSQVDKLKSLEQELKQQSPHLDSFSLLAKQLCHVCEIPVQTEVQATVSDLKTRWNKLSADLSTRRAQFERCLNKWREYEQEYEKLSDWLNRKEAECNEIVSLREDVAARGDSLRRSETLQQEMDDIQSQVSNLYHLSDDLTRNMSTSSIMMLTSRQSAIEQRLLALRQHLSHYIQGLHEDLSQVNQFREAFAAVKKFLEHAEAVLSLRDPAKTADQPDLQQGLDQLKQLLNQFQVNADRLDELNDLGYRLALDASDAKQLMDLNHRWHSLRADCQERSKTLQGHLLAQQDFSTKCQTWMGFLAATERDLATEIAGNLPELLSQQGKCQKFENEMYSHQQILHAIIHDGQKMLRADEVDDPKGFEQKLKLLSEQWQSVIRRTTQRRDLIDSAVQDWYMFDSMSQQLKTWLGEKAETLKTFEHDKLSLQQIRNLLDKVKTMDSEFQIQAESFRKVHSLGAALLQHADPSASQEIQAATAHLQNEWVEVYKQLEKQRQRLAAVQDDWWQCEADIEEILAWLKSIRHTLSTDIPTTYNELQADLNKCKDIARSLEDSESKRQTLLSREKKLNQLIQAEDMNVLHQRIQLLNKQWDELKSQAELRGHRLHDSTFRWSSLGEQIQTLMGWIENMEAKITSCQDIQVEDLLSRLETEYADVMALKERELQELLLHGQQLVESSSEVRAADINQQLEQLQDKWNRLLQFASFRKKKLQEKVLSVRHLESSMHDLSHWLANMEQELSSPVIYHDCDLQEIQALLEHLQEIQRDIEKHSAGVASVLNLCEVLLHDSDACPTQTESDALQHAMKNLDKRWKNICILCPERRRRIKETWELWETFNTDCRRFSEWLTDMEVKVGDAEDDMPQTVSKEDIRNYEALQHEVHDHLTDLESISKQYRYLAREGRTDNKSLLLSRMQECSDRWDVLQQRITELMQGLRHSASLFEDFMDAQESLMQCLTEVDMRVTNIEHLSQLDYPTKIREFQRIEEELNDRRHRMDYLNKAAELLTNQENQEIALKVKQELNEYRLLSRQVMDRVASCRDKLYKMKLAQVSCVQSEPRSSTLMEERVATRRWDDSELDDYLRRSPPDSPYKHYTGAGDAGLPKASVSPVHRRSHSPSRRSASPSRRSPTFRWSRDVTDSGDWRTRERSAKIDVLLEQLADAVEAATAHLDVVERQLESYSSADNSVTHKQWQSLVECENQVDTVQRLDRLLKIEASNATTPTIDAQVLRITERWERIKSRASDRNLHISQQQRDLSKFSADVDDLLMWLTEADALLTSHETLPSDIAQFSVIIRQHKDLMDQLETKRARILSIQLLSKNYVDTKTAEGRHLQSRVNKMKQQWESVRRIASETHHRLQRALLQCQEFHHSVQDYLLWLEGLEARVQRCEPVRLSAEASLLWDKYNMLKAVRSELEEKQAAVMTLRETADHLLVSGELPEMSAVRDKTYIISNRLHSLLNKTSAHLQSLETKLGIKTTRVDRREGRLPSILHPSIRSRTRSPFALLRKLLFGEPSISLPVDQTTSAK